MSDLRIPCLAGSPDVSPPRTVIPRGSPLVMARMWHGHRGLVGVSVPLLRKAVHAIDGDR
jgi:hypothetical protein